MMGRPTLFCETRANKILDALKIGATKKCAALSSGISESTFFEWQRERPDFQEQIEGAEAQAELNHTSTIAKAAAGKIVVREKITVHKDGSQVIEREYQPADWRASIEYLKRRRRLDWSETEIDPRRLSDAQLLQAIIGQQAKGESPNEP